MRTWTLFEGLRRTKSFPLLANAGKDGRRQAAAAAEVGTPMK